MEQQQKNDANLFYSAVWLGNAEQVRRVLGRIPIDTRFQRDRTALHVAAMRGHDAVVTLLLDHGADIGARTVAGETPLHEAAYNNRTAVVSTLLDRGADADARTVSQATPLHYASLVLRDHRAAAEEVVRLLAERGADVNARDQRGETPLHGTARYEDHGATRVLLRHGARPMTRNSADETPLGLAIVNNDAQTFSAFLRAGAFPPVPASLPHHTNQAIRRLVADRLRQLRRQTASAKALSVLSQKQNKTIYKKRHGVVLSQPLKQHIASYADPSHIPIQQVSSFLRYLSDRTGKTQTRQTMDAMDPLQRARYYAQYRQHKKDPFPGSS